MTTLITRLFPDEKSAKAAVDRLIFRGLPRMACTVIASADDAEAALIKARVHESAVGPYAKALAKGNAVVVVRATYKPLAAPRITREVLGRFDTIQPGNAVEEHQLPWERDHAPSILKDHPRFLTLAARPSHDRISNNFGLSTVSTERVKRPAWHGRVSTFFWPMDLVSKKKRSSSVMDGNRRMSRLFWPMDLVSKKPRRTSVIEGGGFPLSRLFKLPLTTTRS